MFPYLATGLMLMIIPERIFWCKSRCRGL